MKRYKHSLSNYKLASMDMGKLYPVGCLEVLPGDTFQHSTSALIRMAPMLAPVMHPVQVRIHSFFVPNRLLWEDWEDYITGANPAAQPPQIVTGIDNELYDYLGVDTSAQSLPLSAMPVRAYNKIFNEYYRDQDLVTEVAEDSTDIQNIAWGKDYFTAARPWAQKGGEVTLPLGDKAPVLGIAKATQTYNGLDIPVFETGGSASTTYASASKTDGSADDGDNTAWIEQDPENPGFPNIYADLSNASAVDVNDVRRAFALQRYQEARSRYGSRYTEYLRYLGITPSDARLQRPEYLGGGNQVINFSEVLQTASDDIGAEQTPVGTLRGHGISALRSKKYRRFFEEHGFVITMMSVRPKSIYNNTVHRKFFRNSKEDYFQKELETIGQQEIYNVEVYNGATPEEFFGTFGYTDRYREYREEPSTVAGDFRDTLNFWHLARDFDSQPVLNQSFTDCVPTKRIFAEQNTDVLWCMINHNVKARRMVNANANARII